LEGENNNILEKRCRGKFLLPRGFNVCLDISFEEN
jgi:hypothetical protein